MARTKGFPVLRRLAINNTAFAAISEDIERQWLALGVPPSRMIRMASGVDAEPLPPGPERRRGRRCRRGLGSSSRAGSTRRRTSTSCSTSGPRSPRGPARRSSSSATAPSATGSRRGRSELGVGDRVHFAGPVATPAEHLRAADAFALPSVAEGMSNSLLEAMATALPCLASDIGGNTDLLGVGEAGLLLARRPARPGPRPSSASSPTATSPRRLGASARRRIDDEFALPRVVDRYVALYRRLLAGEPVAEVNPPSAGGRATPAPAG